MDYQVQDPYYIQEDLEHLKDYVTFYKQRENERILEEIRMEMELEIDPLVAFIEQQISGSLGLSSGFEETVENRIAELNYFEYDQYKSDYRMFLRLAGKDFCFYPYWNFKNTIHPSYQIHPFLWNLVEKAETGDTVKEMFYSHNVDELLASKVSVYIDELLGEYGEIIDKWKFPNVRDFSGYTSRYEKSRHTPGKYVRFSEVVDYEGPFYPPAIDFLQSCGGNYLPALNSVVEGATNRTILDRISDDRTINSLLVPNSQPPSEEALLSALSWVSGISELGEDGLLFQVRKYLNETSPLDYSPYRFAESIALACGETFYGKYYFHLQLDDDQREYVAKQLSVYYLDPPEERDYTTVGDIVSGDVPGNELDIYRYGEDSFENMYILYKRYGKQDPSFKDKQNTPGILWIRLKDHPVAFPAFAGPYPQVDMSNVNIAFSEMDGGDFREFYDFAFSEDQTQMHLVSRNHTSGVSEDVMTYENPWIVMTPIGMTESGPVLVDMSHDSDLRDYIESGWGETLPTHLSAMTEEPVVNYRYLGSFTNRDDDIDHVYVLNSYSLSGNQLSDTLLVVTTRDCVVYGNPLSIFCDLSDQVSDQIVFGKYTDGYDAHLAIAYVGKNDVGEVSSRADLDESVVLSANVSGFPTTVPFHRSEVTSHDIYEGDIRILDFLIDEETAELKKDSSFNTNADMSYIPSYPGYENRISLRKVDREREAFSVEFLGKTGDLEDSISRTTEVVDPYIDEERLNANDIFGRVYEDWDEEWARNNRTAAIFRSPMLNFGDSRDA